ncbi:hypothetical protein [Pseudomarimonas arenosa]|uniref:Uncharacterized protein n=1 Tax=Pseudomarimonas arenosa TaxID=2774145 RepID=A0AAW3ZV56_9GAMM|nr:hypothetical protein [Pseudomarimonas arenosa]MBD8528314.1 hypothetical protein [Pseudomarimonas arenosa]
MKNKLLVSGLAAISLGLGFGINTAQANSYCQSICYDDYNQCVSSGGTALECRSELRLCLKRCIFS